MENNIELRSEKVKNIIGQIPPRIIRIGITVFSVIFIFLGMIAWFYKFPNTLEIEAYLWNNCDSISYSLYIPVHQTDIIKSGQEIIFILSENSNPEMINLKSKIHSFDSTIMINKYGSYNNFSGAFKGKNILIADTIKVKAVIIGNNLNLVEWLFIH
jgi:hypothetical protein